MPKRRGRSASMLKLANQKKESKVRLEEANVHLKSGNLLKALSAYDKSLELNPTEKHALVARSKCYILLGQPKNALKDAESALALDKKFLRGIYQKAEALYYLGDFEHSLMYFHRGLHVRHDQEEFKMGAEKAQKAIETALGIGAPDVTAARTSRASSRAKSCTPDTINSKSRISNENRLLRELAVDKQYLDGLLINPDIKCKFKESEPALEYIQEAVDYLNRRQEFWRQQLPPNLRK